MRQLDTLFFVHIPFVKEMAKGVYKLRNVMLDVTLRHAQYTVNVENAVFIQTKFLSIEPILLDECRCPDLIFAHI